MSLSIMNAASPRGWLWRRPLLGALAGFFAIIAAAVWAASTQAPENGPREVLQLGKNSGHTILHMLARQWVHNTTHARALRVCHHCHATRVKRHVKLMTTRVTKVSPSELLLPLI